MGRRSSSTEGLRLTLAARVSSSRPVRPLTLIQWPQMGSLTASSPPGGPDRQVFEERASFLSHGQGP